MPHLRRLFSLLGDAAGAAALFGLLWLGLLAGHALGM